MSFRWGRRRGRRRLRDESLPIVSESCDEQDIYIYDSCYSFQQFSHFRIFSFLLQTTSFSIFIQRYKLMMIKKKTWTLRSSPDTHHWTRSSLCRKHWRQPTSLCPGWERNTYHPLNFFFRFVFQKRLIFFWSDNFDF